MSDKHPHEWKKDLLILGFTLGGILVAWWSWRGDFETPEARPADGERAQRQQESHFKTVQYNLSRDGKPSLGLTADEMAMNNVTGKTTFFVPRGVAYSSDQKPIDYTGQSGLWWEKDQRLLLRGDVKIHMENSEIMGDEVEYLMAKEEMNATGHVQSLSLMPENGDRVEVKSNRAQAWSKSGVARYWGNVDGHIKRQRAYEENIYFNSDDLYSYRAEMKIELLGHALVKKQGFVSTAHRGEIFLENYNKKLKYFALYDDVKVTEKLQLEGGKTLERKAFGEKMEGIMSEDKVILTGSPKVIQEKDIIKGNVIVLRENNEVVEVDDANSNFILR